jgi:hypothetical protein
MVADLVFDPAVEPGHDDADGTTVVETERDPLAYELRRDRLRAEVEAPLEALQARDGHPVGRRGLMPVELIAHPMEQRVATAQFAFTHTCFDSRAQRILPAR